MVLLLDDELPAFELFPLLVGAAELELPLFALPALLLVPPLAELPELDCAFPTALSLPLLFDDELLAFELLVLPLFELLAPFPVVVDELLSVGAVVLEPPLLEPLFDGELLVLPLPSLLVLSLPLTELPELDCAFPTALSLPLLPDDESLAVELLELLLFELLAPFPVVTDGLLSAGVVVLEPPLLEPLLDGELLVFSLFDAGETELPLPDVD